MYGWRLWCQGEALTLGLLEVPCKSVDTSRAYITIDEMSQNSTPPDLVR